MIIGAALTIAAETNFWLDFAYSNRDRLDAARKGEESTDFFLF